MDLLALYLKHGVRWVLQMGLAWRGKWCFTSVVGFGGDRALILKSTHLCGVGFRDTEGVPLELKWGTCCCTYQERHTWCCTYQEMFTWCCTYQEMHTHCCTYQEMSTWCCTYQEMQAQFCAGRQVVSLFWHGDTPLLTSPSFQRGELAHLQ